MRIGFKAAGNRWLAAMLSAGALAGGVITLGAAQVQAADSVQTITFDFPVAVAGPLAQDVTELVNQFNDSHPNIHVNPVFAGDYTTIMTKVQTGYKSGEMPDVAVLLSTDVYTLLDMGAIVPFDNFTMGDKSGKAFLDSFYPAFMANSRSSSYQQKYGIPTWGIPFQRSVLVMYYNKDEFKAAGLNPNKPPKTWAELVVDGKKLTKSDGTQWGLEIPTSGLTYWEFEPFAIQNGQNVVGAAANKVSFNDPAVVKALQFFGDLSLKDKIEPAGLTGWTNAPADFETGKAAMIYHSSGSLTNILKASRFDVGVAMLPGQKTFGSPTGGGNFYIMNSHNPSKEQAAYAFVRWMTSPENAAKWSVATGYVATSPAAYQTKTMKDYLSKTPQAQAAPAELKYAQKELSTHDGQEIQSILSTAVQSVLTNGVAPRQALDNAQQQAEAILKKYKH